MTPGSTNEYVLILGFVFFIDCEIYIDAVEKVIISIQIPCSGGVMRIKTLVENDLHPSCGDLKAEHGLSFYVEHQNYVFMSDVGASGFFAENAVRLGVDLGSVDALAITHHHYDHGGGLKRFFQENDSAKVFLRWTEAVDFIAEDDPFKTRYIGLDQAVLAEYADRIVYVKGDREILPGVNLLTDIPLMHPKPAGDHRLKMKIGKHATRDPFDHELVTVLVEEDGLVLLTGCAHNGVLNMIETAKIAFPDQPIQAVIGGFHLRREDQSVVREIGESLLDMDIPAIYTGHCTGEEACEVLESVLGDRFHRLYTGLVMTF
jgi:7,8-dihydropterin-6-yl-methyl-4-(beta-D-ribofuranosyl)aminobenzene 5'-phosphate synthase